MPVTGTVSSPSWPTLAVLMLTLSTAKTHIGRLLMKLGARDRAQLVIAAYDNGLVGASKPT